MCTEDDVTAGVESHYNQRRLTRSVMLDSSVDSNRKVCESRHKLESCVKLCNVPLACTVRRRNNFGGIVCGFCGGGLTCLEWDFGSGGLKKESGSFLILIGREGGTILFFGFITALKRASKSVSESPRTCTI